MIAWNQVHYLYVVTYSIGDYIVHQPIHFTPEAVVGVLAGWLNSSSHQSSVIKFFNRCIPVPLVHNCFLFYSSPAVIEFWVLLVVVKVRGGQVVIVVVIKVIRLMGTATVVIAIWLLGTATFCCGSSISVVVSTTFWGWGSRFEPQVRVRPLLEPEPAKRFRFRYSAEPDSWIPGLKSGLNWVWKVWELDHSQSRWSERSLVVHMEQRKKCVRDQV